jgi:hypothetical protein
MDDFDEPSGGGAMKWVVLGVLVLGGGGVGAYLYTQQQQKAEPEAAPAGPAQVISATEVPPDTQDVRAAKGGEADRIEGIKIRESARRSGGGGGGGGSKNRGPRKKGKDGRSIKIEDSNDPLAGLK